MRALAKKADALWSLHGIKASFLASVASLVDVDEPCPVAAVSARGSGRGIKSGVRGDHGSHVSQPGGSSQHGKQAGGQSKAAA